MNLIVKTRHMELNEALRDYVTLKVFQPLERFLKQPAVSASVELAVSGHAKDGASHQCTVHLHLPYGRSIFIKEARQDMYTAIDLVHHRLLQQVTREHSRHRLTKARKLAVKRRHQQARQSLTACS